MDNLTYQQVLADHYEEIGKNVLVYQNENTEEIHPEDKHVDELENQEDFQKFQPRNTESTLATQLPYIDRTTQSILYNKHVKTHIISIDSRFRFNDYNVELNNLSKVIQVNSSTNFIFRLPLPIKNVISVKMSTIEFPNSFYTFSQSRGNTSFLLTYPSGGTTKEINIDDGNWDISQSGTTSLLQQIKTKIDLAFTTNSIVLTINPSNGKVTFTSPINFDLNFKEGKFLARVKDFGLGYNLGFTNASGLYVGQTKYTGNDIINTIDTNYILINLHPDWKVVYHLNPDRTEFWAFAKVLIDKPKFAVCYDNNQNSLSKEFFFKSPTDITSIPIKVTDPYGQTLNMNGSDFSFSLEVKEVLDSSLYEAMRT
jgi:hypothetical protein